MRLLIVGSGNSFAIENYYHQYLSDLGWDVLRFNAADFFSDFYNAGLANKILFRMGISGLYSGINRDLLELAREKKPDVVWVFKGMEIYPATLQALRKSGIYTVNYNPDNPFIFTGKGSGNSNVTRSISLYDLHFTYNREVEEQLKLLIGADVKYLPFGFELSESDFASIDCESEVIAPAFVGNPDPQRAAFLDSLSCDGIRIHLYGNGWTRFVNPGKYEIHPEVRGLDFWKALRKHRVQINIVRIHNEHSHNMRSFEVPAVGGIMLAKDTLEHRSFFSQGEEAMLYSSAENCSQIIREILSWTSEESDRMRNSARKRSIEGGYSYRDRAKFVSEVLRKKLEELDPRTGI